MAAYTSTGRGECIVYSNDTGRTFTEFEGNPVIRHRGRDPKVFWHGPTQRWVMAVYTEELGSGKGIAIHTSADLKAWERRSYVDGFYECPDLFALPLDGGDAKWVLFGADGEYLVGAFDGATFTPETKKVKAHHGAAWYASQTYDNAPGGRRIRIAWAQVKHPGMPFNQMMYFPTELTLRTTEEGPRLFENPVRELEGLRGPSQVMSYNVKLAPGADNPLAKAKGDLFLIRMTIELKGAEEVRLDIRGLPLAYRVKDQKLSFGDRSATLKPVNDRITLEVLVDRTSVEIFADKGRVYLPMPATFKGEGLSLSVSGGEAMAHAIDVSELKSIWKR